jgi:hypothetical protein
MDTKPQDDQREIYLRRIIMCREVWAGLRRRLDDLDTVDTDTMLEVVTDELDWLATNMPPTSLPEILSKGIVHSEQQA